MAGDGEEATLQGQAKILQIMDNFVESMALKCVVELGVADTLNSHPMTLPQIAARIPFPNLDMYRLSRVMRFLSSRNVFNATCFSQRIHEYKRVFEEAMACNSRIVMKAVLKYYQGGFDNIETIVDVGGGWGAAVAEIVEAHPHIKGFNFDLPNVVAGAPKYPNVIHVGGDMFDTIPINPDAIFLKWILHNWSDEKSEEILKNCRKAVEERKGKLIIVDGVLRPKSENLLDVEAQRYDLKMMVISPSGKERSEDEWEKLLKRGGFSRYTVIKIPSFLSIIEAFPSE
ncbi:(R,S)-reticuline 7-O-methyltransferase-like [Hibiscus syriacus]|uniref:(R,S)-reticuline 7-O-methyltransferase-like n=1 Tax=Hibiscus syriacus TaxID=106335 RepID=UPI0019209F76|nr:(R,S)-reticuline 7-O-methyltransferase-like [Hibiscus syriacus]